MEYEEIRNKALSQTEELRKKLLEDSGRFEDYRMALAYAQSSFGEGISVREFLHKEAGKDQIRSKATRFIGYEITESIRSSTLLYLHSSDTEIITSSVNAETPEEGLQRAFFIGDREAWGYTDINSFEEDDSNPERFPKGFEGESPEIYHLMPVEESDNIDPDDLGNFNRAEIYVMVDDWIMYRHGKNPLGCEEENIDEVYDFLESLGVGS